MGCQRNSLARSISSTLSFCFQRSRVLKFTFKTCLLVPFLQCSWLWTRYEVLNPLKNALKYFLSFSTQCVRWRLSKLSDFFFLFMAFPFYLLPVFENKSELLKLVRITWRGDWVRLEMAVVKQIIITMKFEIEFSLSWLGLSMLIVCLGCLERRGFRASFRN